MKKETIQALKEKHLRVTKNRKIMLELFEKEAYPAASSDIIQKLSTLGVNVADSTVYREINTLVEKGVLRKVYLFDDKESYELAHRKHHHHLICSKCECIEDVELNEVEEEIVRVQKKFEKTSHFTNITHQLEFVGLCNHCV